MLISPQIKKLIDLSLKNIVQNQQFLQKMQL